MILLDRALPLLKPVAFHVPQDQYEKILDTCMVAVDTQHLWESRGTRNSKAGQTCSPPNPLWYLSLLSVLDASKGDLRYEELTAGNLSLTILL